MRCLILGGDGMLGHQLLKQWRDYDVRVTLRAPLKHYSNQLFHQANTFENIDVRDSKKLAELLHNFRPAAVVNCVGVIKQRPAAHDAELCTEINARFPHRLRDLCVTVGARLVHISTDCVFRGDKGGYNEQSIADATDSYGRSKYLGEVHGAPAITLRTSIIGLELKSFASLVEWFLAQRGEIRGFRRAIYSGFTTLELARIIRNVLENHPDLHGLWHVASEPISKFDLLCRLRDRIQKSDVSIVPDDQFVCDRSLDGSAFRKRTGYQPPSWNTMLDELAVQIRQDERFAQSESTIAQQVPVLRQGRMRNDAA